MTGTEVFDYADGRYFTRLAAAFVRGKLGRAGAGLSADELIAEGLAAGLRLHKFKRNAELPRVRKVLGILRGLAPSSLVNLGSGRGTFLWPLLDAFQDLKVTAVDLDPSPAEVIRKLMARWEVPDLTEAHRVEWVTGSEAAAQLLTF